MRIRNAIAVCLLLLASTADAGPPLVADDPHTVGAGNAEVIVNS